MNINWRTLILQILLGLSVATVLLLASINTSKLHDQVRKLHAGAHREPQAADPAEAYMEIVLEASPLAQLSAGFTSIAPSMHLIRLGATRPMSNIDPIEHPARRRFGRIDFSFAFLVFLPIALIPLAHLIYRKCIQRGATEKLLDGRSTLLDFSIERILLPLLASAGLVGLITLACLYSAGLRLGSNELLGMITLWTLMLSLYLLAWILLLSWLLLRASSFSSAIIQYSAVFLLLVFLLPQFMQTLALSIERPKGRLPLIVERRKLMNQPTAETRAQVDRFLVRKGFKALDWTQPLPKPQALALENLRIEEAVAPKLLEFERTVTTLDNIALVSSWASPFLVAQAGVDDIAGTGLARFSAFRTEAIQFHDTWRAYTFKFLANREYLDFDSLRNAPKFNMPDYISSSVVTYSLVRCAYFALICLALMFGISSRLKHVLPKRKRAAR
jgi:ABC-2 type transport system permease protein